MRTRVPRLSEDYQKTSRLVTPSGELLRMGDCREIFRCSSTVSYLGRGVLRPEYRVDGGEFSNSPHFVINGLTTESAELCGFMGVWDSGPDYNIVEITEDRMVLTVRQQNGDFTAGEGWFTLTFVTAF